MYAVWDFNITFTSEKSIKACYDRMVDYYWDKYESDHIVLGDMTKSSAPLRQKLRDLSEYGGPIIFTLPVDSLSVSSLQSTELSDWLTEDLKLLVTLLGDGVTKGSSIILGDDEEDYAELIVYQDTGWEFFPTYSKRSAKEVWTYHRAIIAAMKEYPKLALRYVQNEVLGEEARKILEGTDASTTNT